MPICTRWPRIPHCSAHHWLQRFVADSLHATLHVGYVKARMMGRTAGLVLNDLRSVLPKLGLPINLSRPSMPLFNAQYSLQRCVPNATHVTPQVGVVAPRVMFRRAGSDFLKLGLQIYVHRSNIPYCIARYSLQCCAADIRLATPHGDGVTARLVSRYSGSTSKNWRLTSTEKPDLQFVFEKLNASFFDDRPAFRLTPS